MPEQPPDPRHYDMRIPLPSDPSKDSQTEKKSTDQSESNSDNDSRGKEKISPDRAST